MDKKHNIKELSHSLLLFSSKELIHTKQLCLNYAEANRFQGMWNYCFELFKDFLMEQKHTWYVELGYTYKQEDTLTVS